MSPDPIIYVLLIILLAAIVFGIRLLIRIIKGLLKGDYGINILILSLTLITLIAAFSSGSLKSSLSHWVYEEYIQPDDIFNDRIQDNARKAQYTQNQTEWIRYDYDSLGFSFEYPSDSYSVANANSSVSQGVMIDRDYIGVSNEIKRIERFSNLSNFIQHWGSSSHGQKSGSNLAEYLAANSSSVQFETTTVGDLPAYFTLDNDEVSASDICPHPAHVYLIENQGMIYRLTFRSDEGNELSDIDKRIIDSFRLL